MSQPSLYSCGAITRASAIRVAATLACMGLGVSNGHAQQTGLPVPRLTSVTPATVQPGGSAEITLIGQDLDEPQGLLFSHAGIKATRLTPPVLPPGGKKGATPGQPPLLFKIEAPADTPPGWLDLRLVNKWGVSNPLPLRVSHVLEIVEKEPNNQPEQAQRTELNVAIRGVISANTDVDYFIFSGKKGQNVIISCLTSSIGSPLQAAVEVYTKADKELASGHHYHGGDALLSCRLPADDDYLVRVHSFAYQAGSANHAYRLTISTGPWIDAVFPPVVEAGKTTKLTVFGRNLSGGKLQPDLTISGCPVEKVETTLSVPTQPSLVPGPVSLPATVFMPADLEWVEYTLKSADGLSNPSVLGLARAPLVLDNGDNNSPEKAQAVSLPCEIVGWMKTPRDRNWYVFEAKKGDMWDIDVLGDRIGSPCDLFFVLRDAQTEKVLKTEDDKAPSLDPARYRFVAPADGKYQLAIGSQTTSLVKDPRQQFRVSVRREQPGFKLLVVNQPEAGIVRRGASTALPVLVNRFGDWNGEIQLTAENLPAGITCPPQVVGPGLKQTLLVFSAASDAPLWTGEIKIKGSAVIGGKTITQPVQGVTTAAYYSKSIVLAVRDSAPFNLTAKTDKPVVSQGDKIIVSLAATSFWPDVKAPVQVSGLSLPTGISLSGKNPLVTFGETGKVEMTLLCKADMQPGTYTLLLQGQTQVPFSRTPAAKQPPSIPIKLPSNPVTVTVLPGKVATVTVTPTAPTVKIGKETELVVKVNRLYDYNGTFKVHLVIPDSVKGLAAEETLIPPGKDEIKMALKADPKATAGPRPGLLVRVVATLPQGREAIHEVKLTANVIK